MADMTYGLEAIVPLCYLLPSRVQRIMTLRNNNIGLAKLKELGQCQSRLPGRGSLNRRTNR